MAFSDRIEKLVEAEGSRAALARKTDIDEQLLKKYIDGSIPGADKVVQISKKCDVSLNWLLLDTEDKKVIPQLTSHMRLTTKFKNPDLAERINQEMWDVENIDGMELIEIYDDIRRRKSDLLSKKGLKQETKKSEPQEQKAQTKKIA